MTRESIIGRLIELGLSRENARQCVDTFFEEISRALEKNQAVTLKNFATFLTKEKPAIRYFNKTTGAVMTLPAKRTVKVKFSSAFRKRVNASALQGDKA